MLHVPGGYQPELNPLTIFVQIPKPNETEGLGVGWPQQATDMEKLKALFEEIKPKV